MLRVSWQQLNWFLKYLCHKCKKGPKIKFVEKVLKSTLVEKENKEHHLSINWSNCFKNPDISTLENKVNPLLTLISQKITKLASKPKSCTHSIPIP